MATKNERFVHISEPINEILASFGLENQSSMARHIRLSRGEVALVDSEDYERVSKYKWSLTVRVSSSGKIRKYAFRNVRDGSQHTQYLHRFIISAMENQHVDHVDHDGLNNQRSNLRICNKVQNGANAGKNLTRRTSNYKGVSWNKKTNKWVVFIKCKQEHKYLGLFVNEQDAALAYNDAALHYFGPFANTNEVPNA